MRDFFHGWRRKAGCGALVLALVFTAGWIRSLVIKNEEWSFTVAGHQHLVFFNGGVLDWRSCAIDHAPTKGWVMLGIDRYATRLLFPYIIIPVPLTLLSTYLILWKPRPKPKGEPDA